MSANDASPDPTSTTILVLNFNGRQHLDGCLSSLGEMDVFLPGRPGVVREGVSPFKVWLIDNGSADGSVEHVTRYHPWVRVVANETNLGFSRAYNRAVGLCETRWIAFLNNDTRVKADWISALHSVAERHPDAAAIASRIMSWDGERIDFVGADTFFTGHALQQEVGASAVGRRFATRPLLFGCAGALMFRRDLFVELGGFDPAYFSFFEDVDLGWRAALAGFETWFASDAVVRHRLHATWGDGITSRGRYLLERNALFTVFKNYADERMGVILLTAAALTFLRALVACPSFSELGSPRVSADALSHLLALGELVPFRRELAIRRRSAQALRRRADGDLLPLFGALDSPPFTLGERFRPAYRRICSPATDESGGRIATWGPEVNAAAEEAAFALAHVCANAVGQRYPVRTFVATDPPLRAELPISGGGSRMLAETRDALARFLDGDTTPAAVEELRTVLERVKALEPNEAQGVPGPLLLPTLEGPERLAAMLERELIAGDVPSISVIVRTRDRLQQLRRALASVAAQHYPRLEVVVVNDGGQDPSSVVEEFRERLQVRLVAHATSAGRARCAQVGLETATSEYVNFLDDDDVLHPHHLRTLAEEQARTGARVVYSNVECLLLAQGVRDCPQVLARSVFASEFDPARLLFENTLPIMSVLAERALALEAGGFDFQFDYFEDWDLWLRLSHRTPFQHIPVVTATYYVTEDSAPREPVESNPRWRYLARLFDKHRGRITGEQWASFYLRYVEAAKVRLSETEAGEAHRETLLADAARRVRELETPVARRLAFRMRRWLRWR